MYHYQKPKKILAPPPLVTEIWIFKVFCPKKGEKSKKIPAGHILDAGQKSFLWKFCAIHRPFWWHQIFFSKFQNLEIVAKSCLIFCQLWKFITFFPTVKFFWQLAHVLSPWKSMIIWKKKLAYIVIDGDMSRQSLVMNQCPVWSKTFFGAASDQI